MANQIGSTSAPSAPLAAVQTSGRRDAARSAPAAPPATSREQTQPGLEITRTAVAQAQVRQVREQQREQMLERLDGLVQGMEALAQRLSADRVSTTQRSVLVSRFNDLQRRVNELDGIVGSEGRESRGQRHLGNLADVPGTLEAGERDTAQRLRDVRRQIQVERRGAVTRRQEAQLQIDEQLQALQTPSAAPTEQSVRQTQEAIQTRGMESVGTVPDSGNLVDLQA